MPAVVSVLWLCMAGMGDAASLDFDPPLNSAEHQITVIDRRVRRQRNLLKLHRRLGYLLIIH